MNSLFKNVTPWGNGLNHSVGTATNRHCPSATIQSQDMDLHGFHRKTSDELWKGTLELAELSEEQVFRFPQLGQLDNKFENP